MESDQQQPKKQESGEYDLAPTAPVVTAPSSPSNAPDPRLDTPEPSHAASSAGGNHDENTNSRPDLETGKAKTIRIDLPCARCGRNLKDQPRVGPCPECGFEIELSLQGDRLDFADPQWVITLRRGARLMFLASIILLLAYVMRVFFQNVPVSAIMLAVAAIIEFMGVRGITIKQPLPHARKHPHTLAPLLFALAAQTIAGAVLVALLCFWDGAPKWLFNTACILTLLAAAARFIPQGYYLQQINQRIPNDSAAGEWMILGWLLAGASTFIALIYVPNAAYFSEQWGIFHIIPIAFGAVFSVWYLKITRTLSGDLAASAYTAATPRKQKTV